MSALYREMSFFVRTPEFHGDGAFKKYVSWMTVSTEKNVEKNYHLQSEKIDKSLFSPIYMFVYF